MTLIYGGMYICSLPSMTCRFELLPWNGELGVKFSIGDWHGEPQTAAFISMVGAQHLLQWLREDDQLVYEQTHLHMVRNANGSVDVTLNHLFQTHLSAQEADTLAAFLEMAACDIAAKSA